MTALYSSGDSTTWGAELDNKKVERYSSLISNENSWIDCNNASAGMSNDYMFRQTLRDVTHWLDTKQVWSEETGWVTSDELCVIIGWTAPTRFEWWEGGKFVQERLWVPYDKWGETDSDKMTDAMFAINQTQDIPSYIRTFNNVITLHSFLKQHNIPHFFFNTFYHYDISEEPTQKIDMFGKEEHQTGLKRLWKFLPSTFKEYNMYDFLEKNGGDLLTRKHPSAKSHKMWADFIIQNDLI
jgi:hypothetical protein